MKLGMTIMELLSKLNFLSLGYSLSLLSRGYRRLCYDFLGYCWLLKWKRESPPPRML